MNAFEELIERSAHVMGQEPYALAAIFFSLFVFTLLYARGMVTKMGQIAAAKIENDVRTEDALRNIVKVLQDIQREIDRANEHLNSTRSVIDKCSAIKNYEQKRSEDEGK